MIQILAVTARYKYADDASVLGIVIPKFENPIEAIKWCERRDWKVVGTDGEVYNLSVTSTDKMQHSFEVFYG